jgi:plasmid maintenance system antidote protein VapI
MLSCLCKHASFDLKHTFAMSYGERLGQALKAATGKTRVGLAAALNISPQAVGQAVNGLTRAFTAENNAKAAAYLGCSPDWLATGKGR